MGMVLKGPTGAALLIQDGAGDDPDMVNVTYSLADAGATDLPNLDRWTAGTYQPTQYYTQTMRSRHPAPEPFTEIPDRPAAALPHPSIFNGTAPNGTWSLYVVDFVAGDDGEITGGWSIEITTNGPPANVQNVSDYNGDGKTDWALVRNTGGGPGGQLTWYHTEQTDMPERVLSTRYGAARATSSFPTITTATTRPTSESGVRVETNFYILQSQTSTLRAEQFGIPTDDPSIVGDYDGDGNPDLAVYRAGVLQPGAPSTWFWRVTAGGPSFARTRDRTATSRHRATMITTASSTSWSNVMPAADRQPSGQTVLSAAPGVISRYSIFGTPTDVIVPGDYDGDGKTDLLRLSEVLWEARSFGVMSPALTSTPSLAARSEFPQQISRHRGDYDGDGTTDFAVRRPDVSPTNNFFYVRKSSDGTLLANEWGQNGDYPPANYDTH